MDKIKIMLEPVRETNQTISSTVPSVNQVKSGVMSVRNRLYSDVLRRNGISAGFNSVNSLLTDIVNRTNNLTRAIDMFVRMYELNEQKLMDTEIRTFLTLIPSVDRMPSKNANSFLDDISTKDKNKILSKLVNMVIANTPSFAGRYGMTSVSLWAADKFLVPVFNFNDYKESTSLLQYYFPDYSLGLLGIEAESSKRELSLTNYLLKYSSKNQDRTLYFGKIAGTIEDKNKARYEFDDLNNSIEKWLQNKGYLNDDDDNILYDLRTGDVKRNSDEDVVSTKKATLMEKEISGTLSASMLEGKISKEGKYANGSVEAKVGNAEASGSLSAGFYSMDKDGNRYISPGVSANVGVSVSALEVDAEGQIGSDMAGLYGKIGGEVLAAEATAGLSLGMVNGKFEASAKAEAEAVLAEIEGEVGVNILGGEVGVSAGVKVGVGAKADFGYSDGKIKCEIGASLGIGVDIGFEVDIGGMVDTVQKGAESALNFISDGFNNLFNW